MIANIDYYTGAAWRSDKLLVQASTARIRINSEKAAICEMHSSLPNPSLPSPNMI